MHILTALVLLFFSTPLIAVQVLPTETLLSKFITPFMKRHKIPGISIAIYFKGQGATYAYGLANISQKREVCSDTLFKIASITQVFTATELALKVLQGKVALKAPLVRYLLAVKASRTAFINSVTLQQLATHTSNLPRSAPYQRGIKSPFAIIDFIQRFEPKGASLKAKYRYSNLGFGLIGYALENREQKPYESLIKEDVLFPLHMYSTFFTLPSQEAYRFAQGYSQNNKPIAIGSKDLLPASGALISTGNDMLKFIKANLYLQGPQSLLKAMQLAQREFFSIDKRLSIGLGWQRLDDQKMLIIDKHGAVAGFCSYIGLLPHKKIGIAIMVNKTKINCAKFGRKLLRVLSSMP